MFKPVKLSDRLWVAQDITYAYSMFIQYAILSGMFKDLKERRKVSGNDAILFTPMPGKKWAYPSCNPQEPLFNS